MIELAQSTVLVTGATGFLGNRVCQTLRSREAFVVELKHEDCNLTNHGDTLCYLEQSRPDYVIHCAALTGNMLFNGKYPADVFADNTQMNINIVKASHKVRVKKFVGILSSCAFSSDYEVLGPEHICIGRPHESIAAFGMSKRNLWETLLYYRAQYGFNGITVTPTGIYGDGCKFDLDKSKVLESLVKRIVDASLESKDEVVLFGTGQPKREFIYAGDAAFLIVQALTDYTDNYFPLLLGTRDEYSIKQLATMIAEYINYQGKITFDSSKPDGQMRKKLSPVQMAKYFWQYKTLPFKTGLARLIDSYLATKTVKKELVQTC